MKKRRYERFLAMTLSVILAFGIVNVDSLQIIRANTTQAEEIVAQPIEAVLPFAELGVQKENLKVEENPVEETAETKKQEIQAEGQSEEVVNQEAEETEKTNQETQVEDDPVLMGVSGQVGTTASEIEKGEWVYLSDMNWESATSGDAEQDTKPVQKNKPYSSGNNGQMTKISLKMSDTEPRRYFEKGLGTVAGFRGNTSQPSVIAYNLNGLNAKKFSAYLGIDRTAHNAPKHAIVDRIEIVVDNRILFNSKPNFNEVNYNTNAILAEFTIPENAQRLELKAYAGEKTWADEVVYADAKIFVKTTTPEPELEEEGWTYLSNMDWVSATHGDATASKKVQKDKPFSTGNDNLDTPIRMTMENGEIKTFKKGLGTIAGVGENPSVITYDLRGAGATRFKAYVGLDKTAENNRPHDHGLIDKIEVVVDNVVKFTTKTKYPGNVTFKTSAIPVDIEIPANAKKFEIKAYAGDKTWKDEVVYADAKIQKKHRIIQIL